MTHKLLLFFFCACSFNSAIAHEFTPKGPLTVRNQNPIYLQFLNLTPTRAVTVPKGAFEIRLDNAYSNTFEQGFGGNTELLLDMESLRTSLSGRAGVYDGMEAGIEIPFLKFDTGFLDGFVQGYHDAFGFPNSGRQNVADDSFAYRFVEGGTAIYNADQEEFNLGDVTLHFKHNFFAEGDLRPAVAWLYYLKLPTGDSGEGLGSGNMDFGFGTALEKSYRRWHGYLNLGYFVNGGHAKLDKYIYDVYFSYMIGGEFSVSRPVSIVAQITGGSPLLKGTGMKQWDWVPLDLQMGVKGEHKGRYIWQLGFTEDINPNGPSVDFTILGSIGLKL